MVEEIALAGGVANPGAVVRSGDTVRRPAGPHTESVQALLGHLRDVGFDGAPAPLGIDERGREILSYIPGEVPIPPYPAWALRDRTLASVARLLHRSHDAVAGFDPAGRAWSTAFVRRHVDAGEPAFVEMWTSSGGREGERRNLAWIEDNIEGLRRALSDPPPGS